MDNSGYRMFRVGDMISCNIEAFMEQLNDKDEIKGEFYEYVWCDCWEKAGTFCLTSDKKIIKEDK